MTDTAKLKKAIEDSGLKKGQIAKLMGITRASLCNYVNNRSEFRASHIEKLSEILKLDTDQRMAIFFANSGGFNPPNH